MDRRKAVPAELLQSLESVRPRHIVSEALINRDSIGQMGI
jgi:hypothetical protein